MINETERTPEVFRDHFEECWRHFASRFNAKYAPGKKGLFRARKPIADFCSVGDQAVRSWLSSDEKPHTPGGLTDVKLKCFLDLNGYRIIEFERLPRVLRNLSELLGYEVLPVDKVSNILGYARPQNIYPVLREDEHWGLGEEKKTKMFDLWKEKRDELEQKKKEALKLYRLKFLTKAAHVPPTQPLLLPPPSPMTEKTVATQRSAILTILGGALTFFADGLFDELSDDEVATLKEHHGSAIVQLTAHLSALSSRVFGIGSGD